MFFSKIFNNYKAEASELVSSCKKRKDEWLGKRINIFDFIPVRRWAPKNTFFDKIFKHFKAEVSEIVSSSKREKINYLE